MSTVKSLSRREVLQSAALLGMGATATTLTGTVAAEPLPFAEQSGLVTGQPKPLKYDAIPGLLTKDQVTPHYQAHYGGALKRFVAIEAQLDTLYRGDAPLAGDAYTFLHKDKLNRMNSGLLHELYFDNLVPSAPQPGEEIRAALAKRFGSLDRWADDFRGCAMAANGWAILARDIVNGRLYNVSSDLHEVGVIWLGQPLIVCDVYEHAFTSTMKTRSRHTSTSS